MKLITLPGSFGIKHAYEESLRAKKLDIVCLANDYMTVIGDYFDKEYAPKLYERVATREILPDTAENRQDAKKKDQHRNQVRFLNADPSESDYLLYDDKAVLISYDQNQPCAVVIEDQNIAANLRIQFEGLWKSLS